MGSNDKKSLIEVVKHGYIYMLTKFHEHVIINEAATGLGSKSREEKNTKMGLTGFE